MIATSFRAASLFGAGALLISPSAPESLALWGILITSAASLIKDIASRRSDRLKAKQQHEFDVEDRREAASRIHADIKENTAITREAGAKADAAYEVSAQALSEANGVNAKIAAATAALANGQRR